MSAPLFPTKVTEAYSSLPVAYTTARKEDKGYRVIGANGNGRELPEYMHDRHIVNSFKAFRTNPMGKRLIEMQVNFIMGNGLSANSEDNETAAAIYQWWHDPYNKWPSRIIRRIRDLCIYGEWLHRPLVDRDGFVRIADVQPDAIAVVKADPLDHGVCDQVVLKSVADGGLIKENAPINVIRKRLLVYGDGKIGLDKEYSGDLFFFGINTTTDSLRGVGELFTVLDYIDAYDDMLFSRVEKVKMMNHFFWDIAIDGMTESEITAWLAKQTDLPPKDGGVFAHNSAITPTAVVPDLKADDAATDAATVKSHIVASTGWPGTWFDDPGSAGRAVGAEMAEPALRNIVNLQSQVGNLLREEIDYHLWSMWKHGNFSIRPEEVRYSLSFNKPSARDIAKVGPALKNMILGLKEAQGLYALSQQEVRQIIVSAMNQLSVSDIPLAMELPPELAAAAAQAQKMAEDAMKAQANPQRPAAKAKESLDLGKPVPVLSTSRRTLWGAGSY